MSTDPDPILEVEGLNKHFDVKSGLVNDLRTRFTSAEKERVHAVDGVDFDLYPGEAMGIAGESGCGKTTTAMTLAKLHQPTSGTIRFRGEDITDLDGKELTKFRQNVQMIFQDPFESLNPRMTVYDTLAEPLQIHEVPNKRARVARALEFAELQPAEQYLDSYPHELSGGERQRIAIARAIVLDPDFIIADEPVSMLDVSLRAGVLSLLERMTNEFGLSIVYISHDLSLLRHMCDRIAIMYMGRIVEIGTTEQIIDDPKHPYTQALINAVPVPDPTTGRERVELEGEVGDAVHVPSGCRFRHRCPEVIPPEELEIDQRTFRGAMSLRAEVDRGFDAEAFWERTSGEDGSASEEFKEILRDEFVLGEPSRQNRDVLEEAIDLLAEGEVDRAGERLRERFHSVCERVDPATEERLDVADDRRIACHLYEPSGGDRAVDEPSTGESAPADD